MISASWRPRLEFAAKTFIVCAFLGSLAAGVLRLHEKALADPANRVDLGAWSVVSRPSWATLDDVRAIREATRLQGWRAPLLHPGTGPVVQRAIEQAPQVVRVVAMRRSYPDRIEAVLEVRRPVAAVRIGGSAQPASKRGAGGGPERWIETDADGVALSAPLAARPVRDGALLRQVVGAGTGVVAPGGRFGPDVCEAADLSAELDRFGTDEDRALLALLDEIDVSNFGGRTRPAESEIVLRSSGAAVPGAPAAVGAAGAGAAAAQARRTARCDVEWGRARAADPYDPEPPFGEKAARVVQALRMFPGLAAVKTVRVAFDDLAVVPSAGSPLAPPKK